VFGYEITMQYVNLLWIYILS